MILRAPSGRTSSPVFDHSTRLTGDCCDSSTTPAGSPAGDFGSRTLPPNGGSYIWWPGRRPIVERVGPTTSAQFVSTVDRGDPVKWTQFCRQFFSTGTVLLPHVLVIFAAKGSKAARVLGGVAGSVCSVTPLPSEASRRRLRKSDGVYDDSTRSRNLETSRGGAIARVSGNGRMFGVFAFFRSGRAGCMDGPW